MFEETSRVSIRRIITLGWSVVFVAMFILETLHVRDASIPPQGWWLTGGIWLFYFSKRVFEGIGGAAASLLGKRSGAK